MLQNIWSTLHQSFWWSKFGGNCIKHHVLHAGAPWLFLYLTVLAPAHSVWSNGQSWDSCENCNVKRNQTTERYSVFWSWRKKICKRTFLVWTRLQTLPLLSPGKLTLEALAVKTCLLKVLHRDSKLQWGMSRVGVTNHLVLQPMQQASETCVLHLVLHKQPPPLRLNLRYLLLEVRTWCRQIGCWQGLTPWQPIRVAAGGRHISKLILFISLRWEDWAWTSSLMRTVNSKPHISGNGSKQQQWEEYSANVIHYNHKLPTWTSIRSVAISVTLAKKNR